MIRSRSVIVVSILSFVAGAGAMWAQQQQPGSRREPQFENAQVSVWKSIVMPKQPLTLHRHEHGRVLVALTDGQLKVVDGAGKTLDTYNLTAGLLGGFALAALLLAAIGIYGVISFNVAQRAAEMAVRLAFGATPARVARGVIRDSTLLVGSGAIVGCVAAAGLARLITSLLFATETWDTPTYLTVMLTLLVVATFAAWIPARRAGRTDPATVLNRG